MTDKDLSRQLCELAGIKAKRVHRGVSPLCSVDLCKKMKEQFRCDGWSCKDMNCPATYLWVDFKQHENLLKLLNEYFKTYTLNNVKSVDDILKTIIKSVDKNCGLKQALQATEFKY